jgi:argininosuccinate synthase
MPRFVLPVLTLSAADAVSELIREASADVIAVAIDVGQPGDLSGLRAAALGAGATRCHAVDVRDRLADGVIWPVVRSGALMVGGEPLHTAVSLPVVADTVADIVTNEGADGAALWCDDPADRQRLRALLRALRPGLGLVSVRGAGHGTHAVAPATRNATANLWASVGPISDVEPYAAPTSTAGPATIRLGFERGLACALNGVTMTPAELIDSLQTIARDHGVGAWNIAASGQLHAGWRVDAPAAAVLAVARSAIAGRTFDQRTAELADVVADTYAELVRDGGWFTPLREGLDALLARVLATATGDATVLVDRGRIEVSE